MLWFAYDVAVAVVRMTCGPLLVWTGRRLNNMLSRV